MLRIAYVKDANSTHLFAEPFAGGPLQIHSRLNDVVRTRGSNMIGRSGTAVGHPLWFCVLLTLRLLLANEAKAQSQPRQPDASAGNSSSGWVWTYEDLRPTVTSPDWRFSMSLRARLQFDGASYDQDDNGQLASGVITRRAYLGVEGRAFGNFWYEFRM